MGDREGGAVAAVRVIVLLLALMPIATGCGGPPSGAPGQPRTAPTPPALRSVEPCTLLTDPEVRQLIGTTGRPRRSEARSGSSCTVNHATVDDAPVDDRTARLSLRVSLFGDTQTAPSVFAEAVTSVAASQRVTGVGRAAFAVFRDDEVGIVVLTRRAVLAVSLVDSGGRLRSPRETLSRLTPVMREVSTRL